MRRLVIFSVVILLLAIAISIFLKNTSSNPDNEIHPTTKEAVKELPEEKDSQRITELEAGGSSFSDQNSVYTILYPNDYKLDIENEGRVARIYKLGPTQRGQTEMYDGVILTLETFSLNNQSLSSFLDKSINESTADGTIEIINKKTPIKLSGYPGFTYTFRGLGTFDAIVVQKAEDSNFAVRITMLIADPENVGFKKDVDSILTTLKLLK